MAIQFDDHSDCCRGFTNDPICLFGKHNGMLHALFGSDDSLSLMEVAFAAARLSKISNVIIANKLIRTVPVLYAHG
jgi:hypothetical protein